MTESTQDIIERVTLLEHELRRWKVAATIACSLLAAAFLLGQAAPQRRTLEAQEFVLKEPAGPVQARLFASGGGPSMTFSDARDKPRLSLSVLNDETSVTLLRAGAGGNFRYLATFIDRGDAPVLNLYNVHGSYQGKVTPSAEGAGLTYWDTRDRKRLELSLSDSTTSLSFFDPNGHAVWSTSGVADGESK
jgi:hypothetical protein